MAFTPQAGEQYTIRRKILKIFGSAFHIYDHELRVIGYCKQKSFKLKEDIRIYTDESMSRQLVQIQARSIIDFGATYDVSDASGQLIASLRRKGLKSTFVRDEWMLFDRNGLQIAILREESAWHGFVRRTVDLATLLLPQKFDLIRTDGVTIARFRQHLNPFVYRLGISIHEDATAMASMQRCPKCNYDWQIQPRCPECGTPRPSDKIEHLGILAAATLIAVVESRQG